MYKLADKARVNIFISKEVKEWFKDKSSDAGISMSALMAFVLKKYKEEQEREEEVYNWFNEKEKETLDKVARKVFDKVFDKMSQEIFEEVKNSGDLEEIEKEFNKKDD